MATPLIVIVGETNSGKSSLSLQLAQLFGGEIICADALTVRKRANIGTAKPPEEARQLVRHHLLDIIGPNDSFTASDFKKLANQAVEDISERGKLPILVGGSGLYIDGLLYNYSFLPVSNKEERAKLNLLTQTELVEKSRYLGLDTEGLDTNNTRRLVRLIESGGQKPVKNKLRPQTLLIGLELSRDELRARVTERINNMLAEGLEKEVLDLSSQYGWEAEIMKGIGYHEWRAYFDGAVDRQTIEQQIHSDTMDLAKRQRTWFKRNKSIHWFDTPVDLDTIVELVTTFLGS